jgi:hypothetical protein
VRGEKVTGNLNLKKALFVPSIFVKGELDLED